MMARPVVPVNQLARRLPTAGRIRIGVRSGKAMKAIDTFRFTSADRVALDQVAAIHGGEVKPWSDPMASPGQFEIITEASVIPIALPPDPLGGTPTYELWSKGGRARNCDGETCEMLVTGQDGIDLQQCDCICFAKGVLECNLITRLSVLLPEIRFIGTWRIDTKSHNAAEEIPGMVDLIQSLQAKGITRGLLRIESRRQVVAGQTRQFKVPVLGLDESVNALAAGMAQVGALGSIAPLPELGTGSSGGEGLSAGAADAAPAPSGGSEPPPSSPDDEVVDAEIVGETLADLLPEGISDGKALAKAREAARALEMPLPESVTDVTDARLIGATLDLLEVAPA